MTILKKEFYAKPTPEVAKNLLGKVLCRKVDGKILKGKIVETESYTQDDKACHAYGGRRTKRCESLFAEPGTAYVYFTYGMYFCMNISTERKNYGAGVLIRALEPLQNLDNTNGPAKLCREMKIDKSLDGVDVKVRKSNLWIEDGEEVKDFVQTSRIGIKEGLELPWRFYIKGNKWVSNVRNVR